jgi:PAS domain S-box-containing protein
MIFSRRFTLLPAVIRVLHVDDEKSQREFTKIFLEQDGVIKVTSAASGEEALQLLEKESYDCIISDYKMPEMSGIQFAEKIKSHINIPFILYTGRGSEEVAQAAFKAGIDAYIRKEIEPAHFQVLAKNIEQVVERVRGEKSLKASEEKFRQFFMNQPVLCCILSKEGNIVEVNESVLDTLGYTREELIGKPLTNTLYSPSSRGKAEQLFRRWLETGEIRNEELNIVTKTGEERTVLLNVDAVRDESGGVVQSISVQVDITQRNQMQEELRESEERYRTLVENSPNAISVTKGNTIVYANKRRADLAGKEDPSELVGTSALSQVAEGDREHIIEIRGARERGEKTPLFEYRMLRADGSVRDIICYSSEIKYQGTTAVQHVLNDVTDQKRYEKRLEALHKHATELDKAKTMDDVAERTLNTIKSVLGFNQGGFGIVEGSVLHFIRMIGVSVGEGFELPLDGKGVTIRAARTRKTQLVADIGKDEDYVIGPAGRELGSLSELAVPVKIDGKVVAIINVENEKLDAFNEEDCKLLEIFAEHVASAINRQRDEAKHRKYEQSLEALHMHASELQLAGNVKQVCELTLDAMEQALDFKNASFLFVEKGALKEKGARGTIILDTELPLDGKGITVKAANTKQTVLVNDLRGNHDFVRGPIDSLSELATPVLIDGETVAVLNVESLDLNAFTGEDQRLLETLAQQVASALSRLSGVEMLRFSEEKYRSFMDSLRDAVFVADNNMYLYVNQAAADLLGYESPEEIIDLPPYSVVAPEERKIIKQRTAARARGEDVPNRYELTLLRRDGSRVLTEVNVIKIIYNGKPASLAIHRDITERKKMEELLRESAEKYKDLAESISDVFFAMDKDLRYTYWNKASEKLTGISEKNAIGKSLTEVFPDVKGSKVEQFYLNVLKTKQHQIFKNTYRLGEKDFVFELNAYPTKDGLSVFVKDVTERVKMEERLHSITENLENLLEQNQRSN